MVGRYQFEGVKTWIGRAKPRISASGTSLGRQADAGERGVSQRGARYDLMNDLMSAGCTGSGKTCMINCAQSAARRCAICAARRRRRHRRHRVPRRQGGRRGFRATVCDINSDMLAVGRERAAARHLDDRVSFVEGNAEALAFPDRSSTPTPSRSASATCRGSIWRSARRIAC